MPWTKKKRIKTLIVRNIAWKILFLTHANNEKNTYKEDVLYNEKERNVNNIVFDPCQSFMDPRYPLHPRQNFDLRWNFMDPRHPR